MPSSIRRHHWLSASILLASVLNIAQQFEPYRNTGKMHVWMTMWTVEKMMSRVALWNDLNCVKWDVEWSWAHHWVDRNGSQWCNEVLRGTRVDSWRRAFSQSKQVFAVCARNYIETSVAFDKRWQTLPAHAPLKVGKNMWHLKWLVKCERMHCGCILLRCNKKLGIFVNKDYHHIFLALIFYRPLKGVAYSPRHEIIPVVTVAVDISDCCVFMTSITLIRAIY